MSQNCIFYRIITNRDLWVMTDNALYGYLTSLFWIPVQKSGICSGLYISFIMIYNDVLRFVSKFWTITKMDRKSNFRSTHHDGKHREKKIPKKCNLGIVNWCFLKMLKTFAAIWLGETNVQLLHLLISKPPDGDLSSMM